MNKHIKYFQNYLFSKNLSNKTIEIYGNNIVYLEKYLLSINKDLLTATNDDITNYNTLIFMNLAVLDSKYGWYHTVFVLHFLT